MRYYFGAPVIPPYKNIKNYTFLYDYLMNEIWLSEITPKGGAELIPQDLFNEYSFFILESCRFIVDGMDYEEKTAYQDLVRSAYSNLLIHKDKIEDYFKEYVNSLFNKSIIKKNIPKNISETIIDLMLSELDMSSVLNSLNLETQEIDLQNIKEKTKLDKINFVKKYIHDRTLFFIEYYNEKV